LAPGWTDTRLRDEEDGIPAHERGTGSPFQPIMDVPLGMAGVTDLRGNIVVDRQIG
jgi:hypothetical protein